MNDRLDKILESLPIKAGRDGERRVAFTISMTFDRAKAIVKWIKRKTSEIIDGFLDR